MKQEIIRKIAKERRIHTYLTRCMGYIRGLLYIRQLRHSGVVVCCRSCPYSATLDCNGGRGRRRRRRRRRGRHGRRS